MSQSQQSLNLNLPEMNLSENFFDNFEEISKKYENINIKIDNVKEYENIIKNDTFNDINNIKFHNNNIYDHSNNIINKKKKINNDNIESIFDSPNALKLDNEIRKFNKKEEKKNIEENLFNEYLKSDFYINRNNKNYYLKVCENDNENIIKPNLKEILTHKKWDEDVQFIKENIFNLKNFFPMQKEIINSVLMDKNIYAFFPKKKHKSICYQIPSIISNDGIFLIILSNEVNIKNETLFMSEIGINVLNLNSYENFDNIDIQKNFFNSNIEENMKIIYTTPDKICNDKKLIELILNLYKKNKIKRIVIDEINLMSKWDKNFNQNYLYLKDIKKNFEECTYLLFSDTPSEIIRDNILNLLDLKNILDFKISYNKPNIYFEIKNKKEIKNEMEDLKNIIKINNYIDKSGIIFCNTKNICEKIYQSLLNEKNIKCDCLHEGLYENNQQEIIEKWINNDINIIISNIDINNYHKKDIRFIINFDAPKEFDIFLNRINMLGIDSDPSKYIIYYDIDEINCIKIIDFLEDEYECRRKLLLSYFDENFNKEICYHMCDNCNKNIFLENIECTNECKIILDYIQKNNEKLNYKELSDKLIKDINEEIFIKLNLYGIKKIIRYLIIKGFVRESLLLNNKKSLNITNLGQNLINDNIKEIKIELPLGKKIINKNKIIDKYSYHRNYETNIYHRSKGSFKSEYTLENTKDYGLCEPSEFDDLFEQLKNIRRDILKKENIERKKNSLDGNFLPLDLDDIISNEGLKELVRILPLKEEDINDNNILKNELNLEKYKNEFLPIINKFINIYNIDIDKRKENRQYNYDNDSQSDKSDLKKENNTFNCKDNDLFNYKYNILKEEDDKTFNDRNCLYIGFKRKEHKTASYIFNQLANKSKKSKNKKAKFL